MSRERGPGLEACQQRAALIELVLPDPLLADARACLEPRELTQREDLRGRRAASLGDRLNAAGDERENRRSVPRRYGVNTPIWPVAHIPGRHGPERIRDGAFDDEDQLVADVPMKRKFRVRLDSRHDRSSLGLRIRPQALLAAAQLPLLPWKIAHGNDL